MEAAASDINEEPSVLNGTKLNLIMEDVRCSVFMGAIRVQPLSSSITGIDSLIAGSRPIGYQVGSFAHSYLTESLNISGSRLSSLGSPKEYEKALRLGPSRGGVAAIVDELPCVELFLSRQTDYGIVGQPFTKNYTPFIHPGEQMYIALPRQIDVRRMPFSSDDMIIDRISALKGLLDVTKGFFRKSSLTVDMSTTILKLAETGKLQESHEKWFCKHGCASKRGRRPERNIELHLSSFRALFLLCGGFTRAPLLTFLLRTVCHYMRYTRKQMEPSASSSSARSGARFSEFVRNFFDFIDKKEEAIKMMFTQCDNVQPQISGSGI